VGSFNRAQAAVLECAVLVSRLGCCRRKIEAELAYLHIAVSRRRPAQLEAWGG
jgi:hypothetical protein